MLAIRFLCLIIVVSHLSGCVYWRLYQTKLQMEDFDEKFAIVVADDFNLQFKDPLIYSSDFLELAKLQPTEKQTHNDNYRWRYIFRKIDKENRTIEPKINFHWDLTFNNSDRLVSWSLSSLFIKIAPPVILEVFLRSLSDADIDAFNYRVNVDVDSSEKITARLHKQEDVLLQLGQPLHRYSKAKDNTEVYVYRFILDSPEIEEGYEERAVTKLKLYFDRYTRELVRMSGRYAGLKISINYRKIIEQA